jgi:hypothetical protein
VLSFYDAMRSRCKAVGRQQGRQWLIE